MKQWRVDISPKCEDGNELFITKSGVVRPCFWINEASQEKDFFDKNDNFNMKVTPLKEIVDVHLKKFVDDVKEDPFNGLKVCFYECARSRKD